MQDEEIADTDVEIVSEVTARIGLADVKNFGMLWEECDDLLRKLGCQVNIDLKKVA